MRLTSVYAINVEKNLDSGMKYHVTVKYYDITDAELHGNQLSPLLDAAVKIVATNEEATQ